MINQRNWRGYAPDWFRARYLSTFFESLGALLDTQAQRVLDGRLAAIPYAGPDPGAPRLASGQRIECQPDALPYHSADRLIPLYPTEPVLSQRVRLSRWRQLHAQRGTHRGEMNHVQPYFLPAVTLPVLRIVHQAAPGAPAIWHQLDGSGIYSLYSNGSGNFDYDGRSLWSRWTAFVEMQGNATYTPPHTYDDGHRYDDGSIYDQGTPVPLTAAAQADIATMFADWKGAHSWLGAVVLNWGTPVDPTATPTQDATGWWSLPNGANTWAATVDPTTGLGTRPPYMLWIYDNPVP